MWLNLIKFNPNSIQFNLNFFKFKKEGVIGRKSSTQISHKLCQKVDLFQKEWWRKEPNWRQSSKGQAKNLKTKLLQENGKKSSAKARGVKGLHGAGDSVTRQPAGMWCTGRCSGLVLIEWSGCGVTLPSEENNRCWPGSKPGQFNSLLRLKCTSG